MAKLIYASNMSLDGCTEDAQGNLAWAPPDDDVFASISEVMHQCRTYLYGRRMYETMALWETEPALATQSPLTAAFATIWQSADKVVHSTTLDAPSTERTRIVQSFDADAVRAMKASSTHDLLVGGPTLAGQALAAGLVDEVILWMWPIVLGGLKPALQPGMPLHLGLLHESRVGAGVARLHYEVR